MLTYILYFLTSLQTAFLLHCTQVIDWPKCVVNS